MADGEALRLPDPGQSLRFGYRLSPRNKQIIISVHVVKGEELVDRDEIELTLDEQSLAHLEQTISEAKSDLEKLRPD